MARKPSPTPTDGELRLMRVLWARGESTVGNVVKALPGKDTPAYNTVLTLLRVLERKGYVRHRKAGRAFTFYTIVDQHRVRERALQYFLHQFFDDSPSLLLHSVLDQDRIGPEDLRRVKQAVDQRTLEAAGA